VGFETLIEGAMPCCDATCSLDSSHSDSYRGLIPLRKPVQVKPVATTDVWARRLVIGVCLQVRSVGSCMHI
jgi:hypothetical protein